MSIRDQAAALVPSYIREVFGDATITFSRIVGQTENPAAFSVTGGTPESFDLNGGALSWSTREVAAANGAILGSDKKVICVPDARLGAGCSVTLGNLVYQIVPPIDTRGAGAYMRLNARR